MCVFSLRVAASASACRSLRIFVAQAAEQHGGWPSWSWHKVPWDTSFSEDVGG